MAAARGAICPFEYVHGFPCTYCAPRKSDASGYSSEEPFAILASKPISNKMISCEKTAAQNHPSS